MSAFRKAAAFLCGIAGLFGHARKSTLNTIYREGRAPNPPRPRASSWSTRNKYRGIEQILECPDHAKRVYMVNWGNTHLRNASADTRRKWQRACSDPSFRPHRRHPATGVLASA